MLSVNTMVREIAGSSRNIAGYAICIFSPALMIWTCSVRSIDQFRYGGLNGCLSGAPVGREDSLSPRPVPGLSPAYGYMVYGEDEIPLSQVPERPALRSSRPLKPSGFHPHPGRKPLKT